jgi:hypothetical protein
VKEFRVRFQTGKRVVHPELLLPKKAQQEVIVGSQRLPAASGRLCNGQTRRFKLGSESYKSCGLRFVCFIEFNARFFLEIRWQSVDHVIGRRAQRYK